MAQKIGKGSGAFHLLISQSCNPGKEKKKRLTFDVPVQMNSNQYLQKKPGVKDSFTLSM